MKALIQLILQRILGYDRYLWIFTRYKLATLHRDQNENDFFHFIRIIPDDAHVLDIGANLGLMSYYLAKSKKIKRVDAFEPIPSNLKVLRKVKEKYHLSRLFIHDEALGNENGEIELVLPKVKGVKKQGLSHVKSEKMEAFNEGDTFKARVFKLDDHPISNDSKIDAIKIDVENFEYEVFLGSESLLIRDKPVIYCELWDNKNREDCFTFLKSLGYDVYFLNGKELKAYQRNLSNTQNFFFIHPDH